MPDLFRLKDHSRENQLYINRAVFATFVVIVLLIVLVSRLIYMQVYQHERYATLARNNQVGLVYVAPTRGLIYDRHGELLAKNIPTFNLEIISNQVDNLESTIAALQQYIPISEADINYYKKQLRFKGKFESIPIRTKLSESEVAKFAVVKYQFPGVDVAARLTRYYPENELFSHVIGYMAPISEEELNDIELSQYRGIFQIGKVGIEQSYEKVLHGRVGYKQVETDVRGRIIRTLKEVPPIPGQNLYLSIDKKLQKMADELLKDKEGAVVIIEPNTGDILALVSKPGYNPNWFVQGVDKQQFKQLQSDPQQPLFNRAISGQYPPGSTVKPIIAIEALEQGIISAGTKIFDPGYYKLSEEGREFRGWKRQGHGMVNVEKAIVESSATFFYHLADNLGIDRLHKGLARFGLGNTLGIDIEGEVTGLAPSPEWKQNTKQENWFNGETLNIGIGQGYTLVTPLQVAQFAATFANKGKRFPPSLVQAVGLPDAEPKLLPKTTLPSIELAEPKHWDTVLNALEKVVTTRRGTAHRIYRKGGVRIAGKTGTAQVFSLKEGEVYNERIKRDLRDHSWFMAFAPVEDPKIAVAVLLEHDKGSSVIAAKLIREYVAQQAKG